MSHHPCHIGADRISFVGEVPIQWCRKNHLENIPGVNLTEYFTFKELSHD